MGLAAISRCRLLKKREVIAAASIRSEAIRISIRAVLDARGRIFLNRTKLPSFCMRYTFRDLQFGDCQLAMGRMGRDIRPRNGLSLGLQSHFMFKVAKI